jgi:hypothetical protein
MNSSTGPSFAPPHETEIIKADNLLERNAGGFLTELDMEKRAERRGFNTHNLGVDLASRNQYRPDGQTDRIQSTSF